MVILRDSLSRLSSFYEANLLQKIGKHVTHDFIFCILESCRAKLRLKFQAGLEPAISPFTVPRLNQLSYRELLHSSKYSHKYLSLVWYVIEVNLIRNFKQNTQVAAMATNVIAGFSSSVVKVCDIRCEGCWFKSRSTLRLLFC